MPKSTDRALTRGLPFAAMHGWALATRPVAAPEPEGFTDSSRGSSAATPPERCPHSRFCTLKGVPEFGHDPEMVWKRPKVAVNNWDLFDEE